MSCPDASEAPEFTLRGLDRLLAGLEDCVGEMDDSDIELLDEVGRRVIDGDDRVSANERRVLRRLERRHLT